MQAAYRLMYLARSRHIAFRRLVADTRQVITRYMAMVERPYISFSGGKDSLVSLILFSQMGLVHLPVFTQADDLDYLEKEAYCRQVVARLGFQEYHYEWSEVSARAQVANFDDREKLGGTFSHVIRRFNAGGDYDGNVLGLRQEEAQGRKKLIKYRGQIFQREKTGMTQWVCLPLAYWRGEDVFGLILATGTPYISVYDHDEVLMPHQIRFSWPINPRFFDRGNVAELRRHNPDIYAEMVVLNPQLARYT